MPRFAPQISPFCLPFCKPTVSPPVKYAFVEIDHNVMPYLIYVSRKYNESPLVAVAATGNLAQQYNESYPA